VPLCVPEMLGYELIGSSVSKNVIIGCPSLIRIDLEALLFVSSFLLLDKVRFILIRIDFVPLLT